MCLAQGPQHSDAGEARTRGPSVSSQALYHWATTTLLVTWHHCWLFWTKIASYDCLQNSNQVQDLSSEWVSKNLFSYYSTKTYVIGTQKINEMVLLSTQNIC